MLVQFTRWCIGADGRTPVAVNPTRVDCVGHFTDAFASPSGEFPAGTKIIMKGKQEYIVQGSLHEVAEKLNGNH
jgi:hypothetical protein